MPKIENKEMIVPWTFDDDCGGVDVELVCAYEYSRGTRGIREHGVPMEPDYEPYIRITSIIWDGKEQIKEIPQETLDWIEQYILDRND